MLYSLTSGLRLPLAPADAGIWAVSRARSIAGPGGGRLALRPCPGAGAGGRRHGAAAARRSMPLHLEPWVTLI